MRKTFVILFLLVACALLYWLGPKAALPGRASSQNLDASRSTKSEAPSASSAKLEEILGEDQTAPSDRRQAKQALTEIFAQAPIAEVFKAAAYVNQFPDLSDEEINKLTEGICRFQRSSTEVEAFQYETLRLKLLRALGDRPLPDCRG